MHTIGRKACVEYGWCSSSFSVKGSALATERNTDTFAFACARAFTSSVHQSKRVAVPWFADWPARRPAETTSPKGSKASTDSGSTRTVTSPGTWSTRRG